MTTERWMNYADAAVALGMTTESIRQRARREHWRKQLGNDGKALVLVPADVERVTPGDASGDTGGDAAVPRLLKRSDTDGLATALQSRIDDMERHARELRADLERERAERGQERERAERLVGEVADLARQLARVAEDASMRERDLRDQIASAESALAAARSRPWWRRIAG